MGRSVLITGISRHLGGAMARTLAAQSDVDRIIGVDVIEPLHDIGGAEFVRADIRNPVIAKVLSRSQIDTVVHMGVIATPVQAGGRSAMKEINVIGTMQLLAACQRAESVSKLVVKSSSSVYGAGPRDPAMFVEGMEPRHPPTSGWAKDNVEVEGYVRGFARRRPDVTVTTLRLANVIGPRVVTGMTSYFCLPVVPTVLGYDARMQFLHEDDAIEVLRRATIESFPGTFNVAPRDCLTLSQAIRRSGRIAMPLLRPLVGPVGRRMANGHTADFSAEQVRFLTYGRVIDSSRIERHAGYVPGRSTSEAFDEFVKSRGQGLAANVLSLAGAGGR